MAKDPNLRILVIDDNPEIHKDFIKILTRDSSTTSYLEDIEKKIFGSSDSHSAKLPQFHITVASQGKEGVDYVAQSVSDGNHYALAFVDIRMPPGWNGIETIKQIWALDPDVQIVICTAYSDYSWEATVNELGQKENLLILKKPFDSVAVQQLACALTRKWQLMQDARGYTSMLKQQVSDRTAALQNSLSLVKATLESSSDGILVVNNQKEIIDYNQKFVDMWKIPRAILNEKDQIKLYHVMQEQLKKPEVFFSEMEKLHTDLSVIRAGAVTLKDGRIIEYYTQPQKVAEETVGRVFDFRDITKRMKFEENLEHQATHDSLTGLYNRVMLLDKIKQSIKLADQNGTLFAILFLDLDRFKLVNDSLSHAAGDEILKIAASRLQASMRAEDALARLGGDELIVVMTNLKQEEDVLAKVRKLQAIFQEPFNIGERNVVVTASIGISFYPKDGTTADVLLRNADAAMYRAKEQRGSFQFYTDELNVKCLAKLDEEMQLRQALANNEFFLCYQPQIDIIENKIVAAEVLLRWRHPQKGVILPLDFIPLAEETGLIIAIGEWVMRNACVQNKAWQDAGLPPIRIAVNVAATQFSHQDIVSLVRNILIETKLEPKYLELELTENVIVSTPEIVRAVTELKKIGVTIAVDDFGTGYSSLGYLKKIPLDRLKIDKSFIQHIQFASDDEAIIRAVISMAKNLNLEVIAEGVETQSQLDFLKLNECADVQGFYFSKPLSAQELENLLRDPSRIKMVMAEDV